MEADIFRPSRKQSLYHGPYITIYNGNLDRGRTLREASVWYNYGGLPGLLPTPSAPSLALEKVPFPLGCNQVQGLVVWRVEASVPPRSNLSTKCSYLGRLSQNSRPTSFRELLLPLSEATWTSIMITWAWLLCIGDFQPFSWFLMVIKPPFPPDAWKLPQSLKPSAVSIWWIGC